MKKITGIIWLVLWLAPVQAQQRQTLPDKEKLIEKKLNFLHEKLLLNDSEWKAFRPIAERYERDRWKLVQQKREILRSLRGPQLAELSDDEVAEKLEKLMQLEKKFYLLKERYYNRIKEILPPRKRLLLWKMEYQFRKRLMQSRKGTSRRKPSRN
jgi:hypothetical protein